MGVLVSFDWSETSLDAPIQRLFFHRRFSSTTVTTVSVRLLVGSCRRCRFGSLRGLKRDKYDYVDSSLLGSPGGVPSCMMIRSEDSDFSMHMHMHMLHATVSPSEHSSETKLSGHRGKWAHGHMGTWALQVTRRIYIDEMLSSASICMRQDTMPCIYSVLRMLL